MKAFLAFAATYLALIVAVWIAAGMALANWADVVLPVWVWCAFGFAVACFASANLFDPDVGDS